MNAPDRVSDCLGLPIAQLTKAEFHQLCREWLDAVPRRARHIVTLNVDLVVLAMEEQSMGAAVRAADLRVADGVPLLWWSRLTGRPLPERINGTDFVWEMAEASHQRGYRLFLLGARPEVTAAAEARLVERFPQARIVGRLSPPFGPWSPETDDAIVDAVAAADPDVVLVAFGSPKAEVWISEHLERLRAGLVVGVGGSFDLVAGVQPRAPRWMQARGLEWLYRLGREPGRLAHRYLVRDPRFLVHAARYHLGRRRAGRN